MQQQNRPLITVAMVSYNSSEYINEAIDSVLASSYTNFELLISDDCSTDNTWELITAYSDARINAVRHNHNIGEYNNRNYCLKEATGQYIIYIDGDDKIMPHGLETYSKEAEKHKDCGMIISRPYVAYKSYSSQEAYQRHFLSDNSFLNLALVRVLFNKTLFLALGGFSEKYKSGDDYARLLMAAHHPTLIIPEGLVWWRKSPNSASNRLFNSYSGVQEPFSIKYTFLNSTNLLSKEEYKQARRNLDYKLLNVIKSLIKKGKLLWLIRLMSEYKAISNLELSQTKYKN
ncbi:glycosyltransferase family 2 protein [Saccharicrinis aurantiacus]|uniref:glycosyltransferase family 2 protein n=1 Tax=Saccharicrinis aurantiacus TaxID=1849719 RepID=UPI00094FADE9|nr:glycosyltransferase family A protein [Saccharicrinis aurantiacus]